MQSASSPSTIQDLARCVYRHRGMALLALVGTLAVTAALIFVAPRKYASEAKLFVRMGRETVALDPTATTGQTISVFESRESEINSVRDMLQSRVILEQTVDALTPSLILGLATERWAMSRPAMAAADGSADPGGAAEAWSVMSHESPRERAIQLLEKSVDVSGNRKSSVLTVRVEAASPELAQQILEQYLDAYDNLHLAANHTSGSHDFFSRELTLQRQRMAETLAALQQAKDESKIITIEAKQENLKQQMGEVETARLAVRRDLIASKARIEAQERLIEELPQRLVVEEVEGLPNVAADSMRQRLYDLQILEGELLSKLTQEHPRAAAIRQQISDSERILDQQAPNRTQSTNALNPAAREVQISLAGERSRAIALEAELEAIEAQLEELRGELVALNGAEVRLRQLEQDVQLAEMNYRQYAEHLEQARIGQVLQSERITNVNTVQAASLMPKAVSPNRRLMLAAGLLAAMAGSVLLPVSYEGWQQLTASSLAPASASEVPVSAGIGSAGIGSAGNGSAGNGSVSRAPEVAQL